MTTRVDSGALETQGFKSLKCAAYVAASSFGKDSMATLLLALEHGEPLNAAVYCEVMFDKGISGEVPEHRDFIHQRAIPFLAAHGIPTIILRAQWTFIDSFYRVCTKGQSQGRINAWPLRGKCCIQRDCKLAPIRAYEKQHGNHMIQYVGIASDEPDRLARLQGSRRISLLRKYGKTEADAAEICKRAGLYSPVYEFTSRNGCFFCPNAKKEELRHLYDHHPDLWARLLECQRAPNKATELFHHGFRIDEIDALLQLEADQCSLFETPYSAAA